MRVELGGALVVVFVSAVGSVTFKGIDGIDSIDIGD